MGISKPRNGRKEDWTDRPRLRPWHLFLQLFSLVVFINLVIAITGYIATGDITFYIQFFIVTVLVLIAPMVVIPFLFIRTEFRTRYRTVEEPFDEVISNLDRALKDNCIQFNRHSAKEYRNYGVNPKLRRESIFYNSPKFNWAGYDIKDADIHIIVNNPTTRAPDEILVCIYYFEESSSRVIDNITGAFDQ